MKPDAMRCFLECLTTSTAMLTADSPAIAVWKSAWVSAQSPIIFSSGLMPRETERISSESTSSLWRKYSNRIEATERAASGSAARTCSTQSSSVTDPLYHSRSADAAAVRIFSESPFILSLLS